MRAGIGFLVVAMLLTPAVDGVAKTLAADRTPMTIAFVRYLSAGLIALAVARAAGRRIVVPRGDRLGQVARTALIMAAMTALITALGMVPLVKAVGGFLIAPVVSSLLGIVLWREPPTGPRLAGAAVGCAGAAMLVRPEAGLEPGCLIALLGAYLAATRGARQTDALSTLAVQSLLGAALLAPFALAGGVPAPTPALLGGALALGGVSAVCHFLTVAAYRRADATVLAPFLYFNLLSAMAVGFLWFGESLSWAAVAGLAAIAAGGLMPLMEPGQAFAEPRRPTALRVTAPAIRA